MTEDESKKIRVELDHEQKVIRLGCWFYDLKGVLIAEATEEDKKKYNCGKYMTYPIVDDDWEVRDDECIADGIGRLVIGKKGETVYLSQLHPVLDLNAVELCADYSDILTDLELHGITVSNRMQDNPHEELPETINLAIYRIRNTDTFIISSYEDGYFIPNRECHVGKDGNLYLDTKEHEDENDNKFKQFRQIVYRIAQDVHALSWFFNKPNLRVRCFKDRCFDESHSGDLSIPENWHAAIKTLEDDINSEIAQKQGGYPDDYFRGKLPII